MIQVDRLVPVVPPKGKSLRLVLDTDFANEIDDIYALALAIAYPERIRLEGIVGAHYNNASPGAGPESIRHSCELILRFLKECGLEGKYPVMQGAHPMQYYGHPSESEGVDFIIERALAGTPDEPLWVVGLGACTDLASAILKCPEIKDRVRYVFHARSDRFWPERSKQFNVKGDIHAARTLLHEWVPLVWFDTGTHLMCPLDVSEKFLSKLGSIGKFLHEYRLTRPWFRELQKGFYDMGDIVYLIAPELCRQEIVKAPTMDEYMFFDHEYTNGPMVRVFDIDSNASWNLLFDGLKNMYGL